MKKIKVAHILHSVGGVDVSLRLILEYIDNTRFENIIIQGTRDVNKPYFDKVNTEVKRFRIPIFSEISPLSDFKAIRLAYKIVKREKPDIIHAHSAKGGVVGRIVGALTKTPTIYSPHAFSYLSTNNTFKRSIFLAIEKFFTNGSSCLLALSESERQRAIHEVGFATEKVLLYNNSIAPIEHIQQLSISKTWPEEYICTIGRPSYQKNTELLVNIVNEIKKTRSVHLVIMGVGMVSGDLDKIIKQIRTLGLNDNITLLDWTTREDVFNIVSKSQLYVSTSRYEGMPYSVIEAMALAKACVVSDCDGNRDLITSGYNGYVIKEENAELYSAKIIRLLDDVNLNKKFSAQAKATFLENFNLYENIGIMEDIYTSLIHKA